MISNDSGVISLTHTHTDTTETLHQAIAGGNDTTKETIQVAAYND